MIGEAERMEALQHEQVMRRAAQGLHGGQAEPQPGTAAQAQPGTAVQAMFPPIAAVSAAPEAGPSVGTSAAVQGGLPSVPMDEEDSLPSSVGSYSPADYAALEQFVGHCDDEPLIVCESVSDYSMLSASEKKKALAAARAAERKRQAALKRRAERSARIGGGVPANRGRAPNRGGNGGRRGGGRAISVQENHAQSAPVPRSPLPSPQEAFPELHRHLAASRRSGTPPPSDPQQVEQPRPATPRMDRSEPQHSEAGESSSSVEQVVARGRSGPSGLEVAEIPEAVEPVEHPQAPDPEPAQVAGHPLVPARHLALPSQDPQLAGLQVRLTFSFWYLCYSGFLFRFLVWWGWSAGSFKVWTKPS